VSLATPAVGVPSGPAGLFGRPELQKVADFYDQAPVEANWAGRNYRERLAHYLRLMIPPDSSVLEIGCGSGELLAQLPNRDVTGVDLSARQIARARQRLPFGSFHVQAAEQLNLDGSFDYIVISDTINQAIDVQAIFHALRHVSHPRTRLIMNFHSNLWRPLFAAASSLRIKARQTLTNWLTVPDVRNLLRLSDWEVITTDCRILAPVPLLGLDRLLNRYLAPLLPWFCLSNFVVARPGSAGPEALAPSVSVVIPARNEEGNIEEALRRLPRMGSFTEVIFVEGHSRDRTWAEIQRAMPLYTEFRYTAIQQTGIGKGNAVREAFARATGEILMILDADLTMPPEELPKYYEAVVSNKAEFANGARLVYPLEDRAMQFFNLIANKAFGLIFGWLLGQNVKDTLCGTKVLWRRDYEQIVRGRSYFGEFDPFGDFDLLFGAGRLHLQIVDIPVRYRERVYGATNINRWSHGWLLLRMTLFAARKLKFV
jgi:SAM-dependent methyltransferase